jgi:predicted nucleotide-binding protein (sugar kinase/HSP70/actin superfamily)
VCRLIPFFSFQDLDSTKPAASVKIRVDTIATYLQKRATKVIAAMKATATPVLPPG